MINVGPKVTYRRAACSPSSIIYARPGTCSGVVPRLQRPSLWVFKRAIHAFDVHVVLLQVFLDAAKDSAESRSRQAQQLRVADCFDRQRPLDVADECHLSEMAARPELSNHAELTVFAHFAALDRALFDDVEGFTSLSLVDDELVGGALDDCEAIDQPQLFVFLQLLE